MRSDGPERRAPLTTEEKDEIAQYVIDKVAAEIGKSVARKVFWAIGIVALGIAYWFRDHFAK
jgi:hypothetical protein